MPPTSWGSRVPRSCARATTSSPSRSTSSTAACAVGAVVAPSTKNPILQLQLKVDGTEGILPLKHLGIQTAGTFAPGDVSNAKLYYNTVDDLDTAVQLGETKDLSPSGAGTVVACDVGDATPLDQELVFPNAYLWVTYDVNAGAAVGTIVDAIIPANGITIQNGDGVVNVVDALFVLQVVAEELERTLACPENADVNGIGGVNSTDALLILQYAAGLITSFP